MVAKREMPLRYMQDRRRFLKGLSAAGAASLIPRKGHAEDAPLETGSIRFGYAPNVVCAAPVYMAKSLLQADGFDDFRSVDAASYSQSHQMMQSDQLDFSWDFASACIYSIDSGLPVKILSGLHVGCFELFANETIRSVVDLKGKRVSAGPQVGAEERLFVSAMAAYVGLDPVNDIDWVAPQSETPMQLFLDGRVDAFLSFPPEAQEVRARGVGHVVVNGTLDQPWSQYYCCMINCRAGYAEKHPVATKRVLRAILKATDMCVSNPALVARTLVESGDAANYDYTLQSLSEIPYVRWRDYDPEDSVRFFSLRLHEAGIIKSSPQEIIANGTDWRFLNELRQELKV